MHDKHRISLKRYLLGGNYKIATFIWQDGSYRGELLKDGDIVYHTKAKDTRFQALEEAMNEYRLRTKRR